MNKEKLADYVAHGREIEFKYNGKMFSITYGLIDGKEVISFCQFYEETTEVENVEDLIQVSRDGVTVMQMLESLSEDDIWIY